MQSDVELADLIDGQWIFRGALPPAIDPGPRPMANPRDGFLNSGAGQTKLNRRMNDLRQRSQRRRLIERFLIWHANVCRDEHILQTGRAAASGPLAEAAPVIDHLEARRLFWHKSNPQIVFRVS